MLAAQLAAALPEIRAGATKATVNGHQLDADSRPQLVARLTEWLYAELHAGMADRNLSLALSKRDRWLERAFTEVVPHAAAPVRAVLRSADELLLVEWDGVLVRVPRDRAVLMRSSGEPVGLPGQTAQLPSVGEPIDLLVPPARPALSPGFLFVDGSRPVDLTSGALRVYVHVSDPDSAVGAWRAVLHALESASVAYQAKVLSRARQYPRRDAIVVYLPSAEAAPLVADAVRGLRGIPHETSVFTERLAAGVATAHEPADPRPGRSGLSFGQHRCLVLAHALLDAANRGETREPVIARAFLDAGIDPLHPARNIT
ncbi:T3SS effector HopA1 family protein [Lentzea sp. NPDC051213]|uniref:T3SS effector HopA1 family protein n=1 Tax=Lentzea sp. NPDC051213 TaxID=3364126 RepID=UPI0037B36084